MTKTRQSYKGSWYGSSCKPKGIRFYGGIITSPTHMRGRAGETRKTFSTHAGSKDNELAPEVLPPRDTSRIWEQLVSPESLMRAWAQIKSNPGMMTPGSSSETLDGIDRSWFVHASKLLINSEYVYPNRRRTHIPKPNSQEKRPITITNPRVKIIETAIRAGIEPYFEGVWRWTPCSQQEWQAAQESAKKRTGQLNNSEPRPNKDDWKRNKGGYFRKEWLIPRKFLGCSYGFRPNRSAHDALAKIKYWPSNTVWLLDYDIRKAFDNVNRGRLGNLFKDTITDTRVWDEICKMMNAGIIDVGILFEDKGVAQGSPLSPLLFNIYMHHLDQYITKLAKARYVPPAAAKDSLIAQEGSRLYGNYQLASLPNRLLDHGSVELVAKERLRLLDQHFKKHGRFKGVDQEARSILYARYVDDFIMGIVGPKEFAIEVRDLVNTFLQSDLHLQVKRSELVHRHSNGVKFLGYHINLVSFRLKVRSRTAALEASRRYRRRSLARLAVLDRKLAHGAAYAAKALLIRHFRQSLDEMGVKWHHDPSRNHVARETILKYLEHATKETQNQRAEALTHAAGSPALAHTVTAVPASLGNVALARWEASLTHLYKSQLSSDITRTIESIGQLECDADSPSYKKDRLGPAARTHLKFQALRDDFVRGLKELERQEFSDFRSLADQAGAAAYDKHSKKIKPDNPEVSLLDFQAYSRKLQDARVATQRVPRISVRAPIKDLFLKLRAKGFIHPTKSCAQGNGILTHLSDRELLVLYGSMMRGYLQWYSLADNLGRVKSIIELIRQSCAYTLARKHKKSTRWVYIKYGQDLRLRDAQGEITLPSRNWVRELKQKTSGGDALFGTQGLDLDGLLKKFATMRMRTATIFNRCAVAGCSESDIEIHHIQRLHRRTTHDGRQTILDMKGRRITGLAAVMSAVNRKQIPVCRQHHRELESGKYHPLDLSVIVRTKPNKRRDIDPESLFKVGSCPALKDVEPEA